MLSVNDFRTGLTIEVDNEIWQVLEFQHVKPGKGAAFVRSKLKNLRTGSVQDKTFRAGEKVAKALIETKQMQYLYSSGDLYYFMDNETYEQLSLPAEKLKYELNFLKDNMLVSMITYKGEILGIQLPNTVELTCIETEPSVKGDTVSGATKKAKLETGYVVLVPLFINTGDKIIVDTRTGNYISRA